MEFIIEPPNRFYILNFFPPPPFFFFFLFICIELFFRNEEDIMSLVLYRNNLQKGTRDSFSLYLFWDTIKDIAFIFYFCE